MKMVAEHRRRAPLFTGFKVSSFAAAILAIALAMALTIATADRATRHHGSIDLPHVDHPIAMEEAGREDAITIAILRDGQIFFRQDRVAPGELPDRIRVGLANGAPRKLYFRVDARAKYGNFAAALEAAQSAGVENIGILTERRPHKGDIVDE